MIDIKETIAREIQDLEAYRDRLKVKAHLAKSDLKDAWDRVEGHWPEVQAKFKEMEKPSLAAISEIGDALKGMLSEIRSEYRRIDGDTETKS
jgi:hypothetical protein